MRSRTPSGRPFYPVPANPYCRMDHGLLPYRFAQGRIARPHCPRRLFHRILRDGSLGQPDARQFFQVAWHFLTGIRARSAAVAPPRAHALPLGGRSLPAGLRQYPGAVPSPIFRTSRIGGSRPGNAAPLHSPSMECPWWRRFLAPLHPVLRRSSGSQSPPAPGSAPLPQLPPARLEIENSPALACVREASDGACSCLWKRAPPSLSASTALSPPAVARSFSAGRG